MQFLELDVVLALHRRGLEKHGGMPGIRDMGLVESALGSAQNVYYYGGGDEFAVAAAYAFHLAESQAFLDGNKRVAISAAISFLAMNGWAVSPSAEDPLYDAMMGIARHELTKAGLAEVLKLWSSAVP